MKKLRPVQPSAALANWYQKQLLAMTGDMSRSYKWWVTARFRARRDEIRPPRSAVGVAAPQGGDASLEAARREAIAQDGSPSRDINKELTALGAYWGKKFGEFAQKTARKFADRAFGDITRQMQNSAKASGFPMWKRLTGQSRRSHDVL